MFFDFLLLLMVLLIVGEGKIPVEELAVLNGIPPFGVGPPSSGTDDTNSFSCIFLC